MHNSKITLPLLIMTSSVQNIYIQKSLYKMDSTKTRMKALSIPISLDRKEQI